MFVNFIPQAFKTHQLDVHFGLYYSLFHPIYVKDRESNFTSRQVTENESSNVIELIEQFAESLW
jgi:hypothetical protein